MTVEVTMDDINSEDINELCQVFNVYYDKEKEEKEKEEKEKKQKEKEQKEKEEKVEQKNINSNKSIKKYFTKAINLNKSINMLAFSLVRLSNRAQKKITDSLGENVKNEDEKQQLIQLMKRIHELNNYKKFGKEIKQRKKEKKKNLEEEIKNIERLSCNSTKILEKKQLDNLEKEIINDLYSDAKVDFDKNEEIKTYLLDTINSLCFIQ